MKKIALFDTKSYDKEWFDKCNNDRYEIIYYESKLSEQTVELSKGVQVVCAFVNDDLNRRVIRRLEEMGVELVAMRCAGFSNVDYQAGEKKMKFVRVPAYSPYAVAEFAMGMLLCLNRKIHKAYNRTREFNFNISGLTGMDLHGKTVGVIGTGKIGRIFISICRGFGMKVLAYDLYPDEKADFEYVSLGRLFAESDVISLHCPLTEQTRHIINRRAIEQMKSHAILLNTSRGGLCESQALFTALKEKRIGGAALDVYEEEAEWFFEDHSEKGIQDDTLALLTAMPNVLVTSHQAFLTEEALENIAEVTLANIDAFFAGEELINEIK
ncbi:MAG: 2-hydroxyacid dehydrogenase [Lachnospiraceae bacterium]|nr:2-hydroxyacid dehydrogenase [Lachnospiraceae bacterium]MDD7025974.1 2-hydroxyacid dehydrogenase [Lachnospiraceae bacterium]MDY5699688.1 2-hydroxyacid dehydrogenase [Lachnospiraceae bacterium]